MFENLVDKLTDHLTSRRTFLGRIAAATGAIAASILVPKVAYAGFDNGVCCGLCHSNDPSCMAQSGECTWTWTCYCNQGGLCSCKEVYAMQYGPGGQCQPDGGHFDVLCTNVRCSRVVCPRVCMPNP